MDGYHHPARQPSHPQTAAAHPYQHYQYPYPQPQHQPPVSTSTGAAVSYPTYLEHSQATASAPPAPPAPPAPAPAAQSRLAHTQRVMQATGTPSWGFVVYRGAYGDDAAWSRYLAHMKHEVQQAADSSPSGASSSQQQQQQQQQPASQNLEWTVMDDRQRFENASLETVRQDFAAWVTIQGGAIDDPSVPPRFSHCVYVDQKCLDTLVPFEDWIRLDRHGPIQFLACILIDGQVPVDEQAAVTRKGYPGWMYANVGSLPELYETLGQMHLWDPGNDVYCMPPLIYPGLRKMKR